MSEPELQLLELLKCTNEACGDVYARATTQLDVAATACEASGQRPQAGHIDYGGLSRSNSPPRMRTPPAQPEPSRAPPRTPPPPPPAFEPYRSSLYTELEGLMTEWDTVIADTKESRSPSRGRNAISNPDRP